VAFYASNIDFVLFNSMPQTALIDAQQFGGSHLNAACFSQGFDDYTFFNFIDAFIQW
jgi:hypothetical protein